MLSLTISVHLIRTMVQIARWQGCYPLRDYALLLGGYMDIGDCTVTPKSLNDESDMYMVQRIS